MKVPSFQIGQELRAKDKGMVSQIFEMGEIKGKGRVQRIGALRNHDCTFAQALKGESSKRDADQRIKLRIGSWDNGWLFRSAVAVMHRVVSMSTLKASFSMEIDAVAQFRPLGRREVLVTFQSQESRDILIRHPWMKLWNCPFEEFDPTVALCQEKPRRKASMEIGSNARQGDDDDVERHKAIATNRRGVVGAGWDRLAERAALHGKDKVGAVCRNPKHVSADKHLMLERITSPDLLVDLNHKWVTQWII
ncbi:hypothetical protein RHMOL_Rhmol04G0085000 [Rhododendron molle]|uniref:Uncharacterized protein n=1 Tax=Rhododendron molle TaxID=49168 RepID=A0ACC0NZL8_RHOML|nr:hypothetical protein RHMOL_Rhmol04G0085000 [Rhododendron molle]